MLLALAVYGFLWIYSPIAGIVVGAIWFIWEVVL